MGYSIGIDFGTTNTVISYWDGSKESDGKPKIKGFEYPAQHGSIYIPSIVSYENGMYDVGSYALTTGDYVKAMKMYLPMNDEERNEEGWRGPKTSEEVISDFFKRILKKGEPDSFETRIGPIDEIVLCVPHVWNNELNHSGREKLRSIFLSLELKVRRIVSEPVAASAFFIKHYENLYRSNYVGNLLVFDLGGGTFDVTLCNVSENGKVEGIRNEGNGTTKDTIGKAGVLFDETLIKLAYERVNNGKDFLEEEDYLEMYCSLQDTKHRTPSRRVKTRFIEAEAQRSKEDRDGITIYRVSGIKMLYADVIEAFKEIEVGIHQVLKRIKSEDLSIDAFFLTGGFNQFYLCKRTILDFFGLDEESSQLHDAANDSSIAGKSISFGASLIANNLVNIDERYPHSIGFISYSIGPDFQNRKEYVALIEGGKLLPEYSEVNYSHKEYKKMKQKTITFELYVDFQGDEEYREEFFLKDVELPNERDPMNSWQVGMRIDLSEVIYVIFKDRNGHTKEYELSNISQYGDKIVSKTN